jgi:DNA-binding winged helix-turn-helix (wHTH) protein
LAARVYFADRAGQVVSRDALLAAVGPDVTVGDDSLTQVILKLRKALGARGAIQTIAKGGWRLIARKAPISISSRSDAPLSLSETWSRRG